ncbi:hypothetical protein X798_07778 [Onchocerca flexuosa]|uniref:Uncharacterized protein n=1 Tax=Onchocerca flexuosa TaxID=387005 RepID=A0A238BL58_9BILA|nr:hypothetical protein X798_07778 [Onchocerca flexuosa]
MNAKSQQMVVPVDLEEWTKEEMNNRIRKEEAIAPSFTMGDDNFLANFSCNLLNNKKRRTKLSISANISKIDKIGTFV